MVSAALSLRHSCASPSVIPAPPPPSFLRLPLRHSCAGRNPCDRPTTLDASALSTFHRWIERARWAIKRRRTIEAPAMPSDRLDSCLRRNDGRLRVAQVIELVGHADFGVDGDRSPPPAPTALILNTVALSLRDNSPAGGAIPSDRSAATTPRGPGQGRWDTRRPGQTRSGMVRNGQHRSAAGRRSEAARMMVRVRARRTAPWWVPLNRTRPRSGRARAAGRAAHRARAWRSAGRKRSA